MSKQQVVNELHTPAPKKFPRRSTIIKGFANVRQADLGVFQPYVRENREYRYILFVIDCYSNFLWTRLLKRKNSDDVTKAMIDILNSQQTRKPDNLQADQGK